MATDSKVRQTVRIGLLLPADGPGRDRLVREMRTAHLAADGTDSRRGMEAAYDALREAMVPCWTWGRPSSGRSTSSSRRGTTSEGTRHGTAGCATIGSATHHSPRSRP